MKVLNFINRSPTELSLKNQPNSDQCSNCTLRPQAGSIQKQYECLLIKPQTIVEYREPKDRPIVNNKVKQNLRGIRTQKPTQIQLQRIYLRGKYSKLKNYMVKNMPKKSTNKNFGTNKQNLPQSLAQQPANIGESQKKQTSQARIYIWKIVEGPIQKEQIHQKQIKQINIQRQLEQHFQQSCTGIISIAQIRQTNSGLLKSPSKYISPKINIEALYNESSSRHKPTVATKKSPIKQIPKTEIKQFNKKM